MGIDTAALALDVGFLFLPGTGGGLGYRLAFAGATRAALQTGRVVQTGTKGAQIGHQTALFAKRTDHARQRGQQGRRTNTAFNDAQRAGPRQVFTQDDGRWAVIGPRGRCSYIFSGWYTSYNP